MLLDKYDNANSLWNCRMGLTSKVVYSGRYWFEHAGNACRLAAHYPFDIYPFKNGVACVSWTLYPDGMYFMDEDGFGMEPCVEESTWAYVDTNCKVLVKFQDMEDRHIRERLYEEALMKVKK